MTELFEPIPVWALCAYVALILLLPATDKAAEIFFERGAQRIVRAFVVTYYCQYAALMLMWLYILGLSVRDRFGEVPLPIS